MNFNWKGDAPKEPLRGLCEKAAVDAASAAWNTTGKTFVEATIRGADHEMTTNPLGQRVKDDRHITVNFKDSAEQQNNKHTPAHVYLQGARPDFGVDRVEWFKEMNDPRPRTKRSLAELGEDGYEDIEDDMISEDDGEKEKDE